MTTPYKTDLIIGIDLDGVVADLHTPFRKFVSDRVGRELPAPQSWSMAEWGMDDDEIIKWLREFAIARQYRELPMMEGAAEALRRLSKAGVHLRVITHRLFIPDLHDIFVEDTGYWLQNNNIPYWDICIMGRGGRKFDVGADLYIDDGPHVIQALREYHKAVLIYDQPYNRDIQGLPRARSWDEVVRHVHNTYGLNIPDDVGDSQKFFTHDEPGDPRLASFLHGSN